MQKRYVGGLLLAAGFGAFAQTKVDLGAQSRNVDFSQATSVRPFPTGSTLPQTCNVGQLFFLTAAPVGANQCVAANTWAQIQGSSTIPAASAGGSIGVQRTSTTQLTIGPGCAVSTPCLFRIGSTVYSLLAPVTATVTGGSGLAFVYIDGVGDMTIGVASAGNPAVTCSGCVVVPSITQYPQGIIPMESWNATNGTWDSVGTDNVAALSLPLPLLGGSNITVAQTSANVTISYTGVDGASTTATPLGAFNPADPSQFYLNHLNLVSGWSGADGWGYSGGGCQNGQGSGPVGFSPESMFAGIWAQATGSGSLCFFSFPESASTYGSATWDYWSGVMPATLWVSATYTTGDANGTHYVGLSNSGNGMADFIGCRQSGVGDWFAVIRLAGVDLATADTGYPHDTSNHRITVDNNSGTANTIRCSVDGGDTATVVGTVPSEPNGWFYVEGVVASGSTAATFGAFQHIIFLQGLPRL